MRSLVAFLALLAVSASAFAQVERGAPLPRKGTLGAQLAALSAEESKSQPGVKIVRVMPGLTAEAAKLQADDILVAIDGKPVASAPEVMALLRMLVAGAPVRFDVVRGGKKQTLRSNFVERPRQKGDGEFEIVYDQVQSKGKRLRVIFTHPKGAGPFPTVFLIGGIGGYSVDGEYATIPYGTILGPLARQYAIVRVDKPGQGDSEGPGYTDLMFDDELDGYLQALRLTKTMPFIDKNRIAIFGHSMGGTFGPLVAAQEPVAGVIASGTLAKTWVEYVLENSRRQAMLGGASADQIDEQMRQLAAVSHHLFHEGLTITQIAEKHPDLKEIANAMSPDGKTYSGVNIGFFRQLAQKNIPAAWLKSDAKVLTLWGESEFISTRWDHEYIAEIVNKKRPGTATFKPLPESDHGFWKTTSALESMQKWGRPGSTFNPNVVDAVKASLADNLE